MKTRIIAGLIAAILVIGLMFWGPTELILLACVSCACLAYLEYDRLFFASRSSGRQARMIILILGSVAAMRHGPFWAWIAPWISYVMIAASRVCMSEKHPDFPSAVREVSIELLGYTYIVSLFGFIVPIVSSSEKGRLFLLLLFLLVFVGDTVAFFVGSRWGRHRLAPHISPKKSVEGALAALTSSLVVAALWLWWAPLGTSSLVFKTKILVLGPLISVFAQIGDLFESVMKRSQSLKDSGHFIPGHGGVLDRLDGLALASPIYYFYLLYVLGPGLR